MKTDAPKTIYLKDYEPYPYDILSFDLNFDLHEDYTLITAKARYRRKDSAVKAELYLYGEALEMLSLTIDRQEFSDYTADEAGMTIPAPAQDEFTLEIQTKIYPQDNSRLEGLYMSGGNYCTQCEAEGFRRITYFPDRPDILTIFTVRVEADQTLYPVLLSNGNKQDEGTLEDGRHFTLWHDPFPKPCYLFALVAGDLTQIHDSFTTKSGREVDLYIYVRPGDEAQCDHAMLSLKRSMAWDEETYGLEYELDIFNIVAVSDFNMGAMENTSLNIFNTALVLAHQDTATDQDFLRVEGVIAHEYFHNWSGNRVTCRDWFQLSLKEGLTVFRDQEFSSDMNARAVKRIDDVTHLRRGQFTEDAGPLAHPVRPDNYIEINNFYTMTIYEKGAEVIRMMRTILGAGNYRKGTDLYFARHDGQAVTCDDFVACMEEAGDIDLSHFKLWYSQAGTPEISFKGEYDAHTQTYSIDLEQKTPGTQKQRNKKPVHIPVSLGLLGSEGKDLIETQTLHLTEEKQHFEIKDIKEKPTPSILRNFSAPVKLTSDLSNADLSFLMRHDSDGFNRWEAGQQTSLRMINHMVDTAEKSETPEICPRYMEGFTVLLTQALESGAEKAFFARALSLPDISIIGQSRAIIDPPAIHKQRQAIIRALKKECRPLLDRIYAENAQEEYGIAPEQMGARALRNLALGILSSSHGTGCAGRSKAHYDAADNMTDRVAALSILVDMDNDTTAEALSDFYERFKSYPLVIDKWFGLQAMAKTSNVIQNIKELKEHVDFNIKNPNRTCSLYGAFAMNNPVYFHSENGEGYRLLSDAIIELNAINPQIAARLLTPMREWRRYSPERQALMKAELERILSTPALAPDIFEIASKSLT